jgi:hypothetical protein
MSERISPAWERELTAVLEPVQAPASLWYRVEAALDKPAGPSPRTPRLALALLLVLVLVAGAWFQLRTPPLAAAALQAHREFRLHQRRVDIRQNEPTALRNWIAAQTTLKVALADRPYPDPDGFVLSGARLLRGGRVAIFYQIGGYPATLLIGRAAEARAGAAKQIAHLESNQATLYTWQAHGQSYALVSSIPGTPQQACFACHVEADRRQTILRVKWNG